MGGKHGGRGWVKTLLKNTCEGVHLLVKLPAISLESCKFTKTVLLQTYFSRILARFSVIHCDFSWNHFMEMGFTFQWIGGGGGASFLSRGGGAPLWETLPLDFFWHQPFLTNSESFAISGNTNIDCVLIRNLLFA